MTIEQRLREATHEYADEIEPEPDSWARIETRIETPVARRSPTRGLVVVGVSLVLVLALVGALIATRRSGENTRVSTSPRVGMPSRILAMTAAGKPVVLDSATGREKFGFLSLAYARGTAIAVTPHGNSFYYALGDGNEGCADHSIRRVPVGPGGRRGEEIAREATDPAVSPDGRWLAYLHCLPGDARADQIVLRDLATEAERVVTAPADAFFIRGPQWAPDSRRVVYGLYDDARRSESLREFSLIGGQSAPGTVFPADATEWAGFLGTTGDYLGVEAMQSPTRVVRLSGTGPARAGRLLFTLPEPPNRVVSDVTGRHVVTVVGETL